MLWEHGIRPVGIFGPQRLPDGSNDPIVGEVDLATVTDLGQDYGTFNIERYAALKPDLLVTVMYGDELRYIVDEQVAEVEKFAPIAGIQLQDRLLPAAVERFAELARAFGMATDSPAARAARAEFDAASTQLREAIAAAPGLKVMAVSGDKDNVYVGKRGLYYGDLLYYRELGMDLIEGGGPEADWETISWEQVNRYSADVVLNDARITAFNPEQMAQYSTWRELAAVKAGQVYPWRLETPRSYQSAAPVLRELAENIRKARADIVT